MYDLSLMEDLKEFKRGSESIYELRFRYNNIFRIIKNRTIEKLNVLELLLSEKIIDDEFYEELSERVKSDYNTSHLYLMGLVSLDFR